MHELALAGAGLLYSLEARVAKDLASGRLRVVLERYAPENLPHNLALVDLLRRWAERKEATPA